MNGKGKTVIVMGVSASGKTTIGKAIAAQKHMCFIDGDDLHPAANIEKMRHGTALTDEDRRSWFDIIIDTANKVVLAGEPGVIACSALKKKYRDVLRAGIAELQFVYLKADYEQVYKQMQARKEHFMPVALLKSQFETLEEPGEGETDVLTIVTTDSLQQDIAATVQAVNQII